MMKNKKPTLVLLKTRGTHAQRVAALRKMFNRLKPRAKKSRVT